MGQKNLEKVFIFQITLFEFGVANSHNLERDICHWESMC